MITDREISAIVAQREAYVATQDAAIDGGLTRDGFVIADSEAVELYPMPEGVTQCIECQRPTVGRLCARCYVDNKM